MKITSNTFGNYSPAYVNRTQTRPQEALTTKNETAPVNEEEKKFFQNLYPDKKNEIQDYHFYQRNGKMSGVSVGSLLDKRG